MKVVGAAAIAAAVLVPAASATTSAKLKVSILPLPKSALGAAAKPLSLAFDSGTVSNAFAAANSWSAAGPKTFTKMGRITGYRLDYGAGASGGSGVTEIYTQVDQYKTAAGAKKGLAFWKKDDPQVKQLNQGSFAVTSKLHPVPAIGSKRFAVLTSYADSNISPVWSIDEQFTDGNYELAVTVWAGNQNAATALAPLVAKKLDARLHKALKGRLHAKPVKLPKLPPAGQAPGGPDLSTLALQATDFSGSATTADEGYVPEAPPVLSAYNVFVQPAGDRYDLFDQEIFWYATANQAAFTADLYDAEDLSVGATALDLSSLGDGAQGTLQNGQGFGIGTAYFSSGQLMEALVGITQQTLQASDVQNIAQAAATRINNAGLGS